jgi:hypothetical protein
MTVLARRMDKKPVIVNRCEYVTVREENPDRVRPKYMSVYNHTHEVLCPIKDQVIVIVNGHIRRDVSRCHLQTGIGYRIYRVPDSNCFVIHSRWSIYIILSYSVDEKRMLRGLEANWNALLISNELMRQCGMFIYRMNRAAFEYRINILQLDTGEISWLWPIWNNNYIITVRVHVSRLYNTNKNTGWEIKGNKD